MKQCTKCKLDKNEDKFYFDPSYKNNRKAWCKECTLQRRRDRALGKPLYIVPDGAKRCNGCELNKPYAEFWADSANKTDGKYSHCISCKTASTYKWREKNKEHYNKSMRDYRAKQNPIDRRNIDLKAWFGLPYGWYEKTLAEQGNVCAVCGKPNKATKRCLAVDHHHSTNKVRGILCYKCNRDMNVIDDEDQLQKLLDYKKKHADNK